MGKKPTANPTPAPVPKPDPEVTTQLVSTHATSGINNDDNDCEDKMDRAFKYKAGVKEKNKNKNKTRNGNTRLLQSGGNKNKKKKKKKKKPNKATCAQIKKMKMCGKDYKGPIKRYQEGYKLWYFCAKSCGFCQKKVYLNILEEE